MHHLPSTAFWLGFSIAAATVLAGPTAQAQTVIAPTPFSFDTAYGRLPKNVVPLDYTIALVPNVAAKTLRGKESVTLNFREATATIKFNSLNMKLDHVLFDGKPVASVESSDEQQLTSITLAAPARVGKHTLSFEYDGKIESGPQGMFVQNYTKPDGGKDTLISTKFEATDARRMFPCWDEPAFRATFELTATVPAAWATISNMPVAKRRVAGDLATTTFKRSPKMPTYLVEFSDDLAGWSAAAASFVAATTSATWTDDGTTTGTSPSNRTRRYYRLRASR